MSRTGCLPAWTPLLGELSIPQRHRDLLAAWGPCSYCPDAVSLTIDAADVCTARTSECLPAGRDSLKKYLMLHWVATVAGGSVVVLHDVHTACQPGQPQSALRVALSTA